MTRHSVKTWPKYFRAVSSGAKNFEVRRDDRRFQVGDILVLAEFNPATGRFTGRELERTVSYKMRGGLFGIIKGYCVLGLCETDSLAGPDAVIDRQEEECPKKLE